MFFVSFNPSFSYIHNLNCNFMQCSELVIRQKPNMTIMAQNMGMIETSASARLMSKKPPEKEIIHSGHFMVSNFEADAQDDEDVFASNSDEGKRDDTSSSEVTHGSASGNNQTCAVQKMKPIQHISIETSLTKLFQCMSLAYRQKLTSPKWNRFKGIRLRWKDKIRLNNVIWRCWHMQFITKKNSLVCQFASPLDTDTHNKPEAIVLEGKYWKRKLNAVTAEYKKWRLFSRNRLLGCCAKDGQDPQDMLSELELLEWQPHGDDSHMMVDEDYMEFMTDTLFSTISANQPFAFPDTREIARGASLADFIQPSLVQLQPNLDDFMDTFEPLQELFYSKLPPVPEESQTSVSTDNLYRSLDYQAPQAKPDMSSYQAPSPPSAPPPPPPSQYYHYSPQHQPPPSPKPRPPSYHGAIYSMPQYQQLSPPAAQRTSPSPPNPSQGEYLPPQSHPAPTYPRVPIRSNSLPMAGSVPSRKDEEMFAVPKLKMFSRSRSGSCLAGGSIKPPPPLVSAVSEPQLAVPPPHSTSALLAHLLTSSTTTSHAYTGPAVSGLGQETLKMSESLPSLEASYYKKPERLDKPAQHRSVIYSTQTDNGSLNLSSRGGSIADNRIPQIYETFTFTGGASGGARHRKTSAPMLHYPPPPAALLMSQMSPVQATSQVISSASNSPKHPDSPGASDCLSLSPLNVDSPGSATPHSPTTGVYKEHRRVSHINAEQKRRCNIKNGFDTLHSLIPQLSQNPNAKLSKAAMLQKGAEYIRQLRSDRQQLKDEIDSLRQQVDSLNSAISNCQAMLPATGAPVSRHRSTKMKEMYDEYVRVRTQENWKFWILSLLCEPLLNSFNAQVSTQSLDELYRTTLNWVDQHCTLSVLRPLVLNALRQLCTTTDILSDPGRLPAEARAAVSKGSPRLHPPSTLHNEREIKKLWLVGGKLF